MQTFDHRWIVAALAGAAWIGAATGAETTVPDAGTAQAAAPSGTSAKRVFRDKQTGRLRAPTEEEMQILLEEERAASAARGAPMGPSAPLVVRQYPNGMRAAVLGPDYLVSIKGQRGSDGKLVISHGNTVHGQPAGQAGLPTE